MKRRLSARVYAAILLPVCLLSSARPVQAQAQPKPPFDLDFTAPDLPAFAILGVSPTQIERPTTPKALGLSLLSTTTDSANLIPKDYSVVVAPYWMQHAAVTLGEYVKPGVKQSLLQTFTVSFATARVGAAAANTTDLGLGFSGSPWAGHGSAALARQLARLYVQDARFLGADGLLGELAPVVAAKSLGSLSASARPVLQRFIDNPSPDALKEFVTDRYRLHFAATVHDPEGVKLVDAAAIVAAKKSALDDDQQTLRAAVDNLFASDPLPLLAGPVGDLLRHVPEAPGDSDALSAARGIIAFRVLSQLLAPIKVLRDSTETDMKAVVADVRGEDKMRVGPMLAVSGAIGSRVPDQQFADARRLRWALWASPAYRTDGTNLDLIGVLKWIQREAFEGANLFDVGVRVVKQAGDASFSGEFLGRTERSSAGSNPTTQRMTVNVDYKIAEKVFITAGFGKDFADPSAGKPKGGLLSVLGVNIGLSKSPSVTP